MPRGVRRVERQLSEAAKAAPDAGKGDDGKPSQGLADSSGVTTQGPAPTPADQIEEERAPVELPTHKQTLLTPSPSQELMRDAIEDGVPLPEEAQAALEGAELEKETVAVQPESRLLWGPVFELTSVGGFQGLRLKVLTSENERPVVVASESGEQFVIRYEYREGKFPLQLAFPRHSSQRAPIGFGEFRDG